MNPAFAISLLTAVLALPAALSAQALRVDFDDSAPTPSPAVLAPFYTPGGGSAGLTVRTQYLCPSDFPGLPRSTMRCTAIGFQVEGVGTYSTFDLRAGVAGAVTLQAGWATNLPDQTLQRSGLFTATTGPSAEWIEIPLSHPFLFEPGDGVVIDVTSAVAMSSIGQTLNVATTTVDTGRVVEFQYFGAPTGNVRPTGGIRFRMVFEQVGAPVPYGQGCSTAGEPLTFVARGIADAGATVDLELHEGLANQVAFLLYGRSDRTAPFGSLPLPLGGGCALLTSAEFADQVLVDPNGVAVRSISIPTDPSLSGANVFWQWAQLDPTVPGPLPFVLSDAARLTVQ